MVQKVVLAAALLCLAQGQYIFNDPTKVVKELQPKVDELLNNVEIQVNEVDKSIQSTSKYIDLKIDDANNAVATKLKLLQQETSESQQLEKNIDACMQNHIMAIQSGNVAVLNTIKENANLAIFENQLTELKNLVIQVKVIASNCIGQSQMDSIKTRVCMEERIAAIGKQSTKIHGYVLSSMSMLKQSVGKAIQVRVLNIFDDISKISSEFKACVEQSPTLTIESVIDSKKAEINSLKQAIQDASNEWTKQIADAYKNVNAKVKAADISIDTQVKSLKVVGGDMTLNSCISKHADALNNLDKSELDQCRVQSDLQHASNEIINLPKLQTSIGVAPGNCVEKVGASAKQVQKCIEETLSSVQKQLATITERATTHYVNGMRSGVNCVNNAEDTIQKNIEVVIFDFTSCVKTNSAAVDEAINEYQPKMDTIKSNIRQTVEEWGVEIAEAYSLIKRAVDAARKSVNDQLTSLSTVNLGEEAKECVTEQQNDLNRLDKKALERCQISSALENANMVVVQIATFEGVVEETPSICRTEVGENVDKVKQCIADKLNKIHVDIQQLVSGLYYSVQNAKEGNVQCAQSAHSNLISGLQRIMSTFNICVKTKSALYEEAINEFKDKMDTMKINVRNTVEEWNTEIANSYSEIKSAVDTARSSVNEKITSLNRVGTPKEALECVTEQQDRVGSLDKKSLERCQMSSALESANIVVVEIAKYEALIEETPSICSSEKEIKQCIADKLNTMHVDIQQFVSGLKHTVPKAKESQLQCSEYTSSKLISDIEGISSSFNLCIDESFLTTEQVIDSLQEDLNKFKSSARNSINQYNDQIASGFNNLQKIILEASESVNSKLSNLKLQEEHDLIKSCIQEEKILINNLDQSELHSCARTSGLSSASEYIAQIAKIEANIGGLVGICVKGNTVRQFKKCMENGIKEGNVVLNTLIEQTRVTYINGMQNGRSCIVNNKSTLLSQIEEINSRYNTCVDVNTLKANLSELKTKAKDSSDEWIKQIKNAQVNLDNKIKIAATTINSQIIPVQKYDGTNVNANKCTEQVQSEINNLNLDSLRACSASKDLQLLSLKADLFVRIESSISSSEGFCSNAATDAEAKKCLETAIDTDSYQIDLLNKQLNELYVSGMKSGIECIKNTQEQFISSIKIIVAKFNMCLH